MDADNAPDVAFADPPVVSVSLTLFFEPVQGLQVSHLSSLRERWRGEYSTVAELPPLRPRNRGGDEGVLMPLGAWPCPYVMFSTDDDESSIAIQNDRFIRTWSFASGESQGSYPGFAHIRDDLASHFDEFVATLKSELDLDVVLTGSECDYTNVLDDMPIAELMVGVTTRWSVKAEGATSASATYGGVRMHLCKDDDLEGCSVNLALDVDSDGAFLGIVSSFDLADQGEDAPVVLGGLDRAHDKLIATFVEYTSDEMHGRWGREA